MLPRMPAPKPVPEPSPLAERVAVGLLCLGALVGPLALGSTGARARFALEAVMAIAAILWAVSGRRSTKSLMLPVAISGLVLLQLIPLPEGLLVNVAPVSAGRWKVAREGMSDAWATISVAPAPTAVAIRRLLIALATIAAVADLSRKAMYRRWLYTALAISGVLILAAGLVFRVNPKQRIVMGFFSLRGPIDFWKTPEHPPLQTSGFGYLDWVTVGTQRYQADGAVCGDGFGSYIYSNHFANAVCLTLPAVWVLWLLYTRNRLPTALRYAVLLGSMAAAAWKTGVMAQSRAGTASLVFAAIVYLSLIAQSRWLRWITGGGAAVIAAGLVGFVAVFQGPFSALAGIMPAGLQETIAKIFVDNRIVAAHMAGRMFLASPLLGTGLGTYGDLYPWFARTDHVLYFAHNDYAQLLAETGLLGGGIAARTAWVLGSRFWRFCKERLPANRMIDAGAWAALAGAAAHGVFDWNMHAPANAFLACIVVGLCLSSVAPPKGQPTAQRPAWQGRTATIVFSAACLVALVFLARDAFTDLTLKDLRKATTAARIAAKDPKNPSEAPALTAAIKRGERAARLDPGNWQLAVLLGQANLHLAAQPDGIDAKAYQNAAGQWFTTARRNSAATRGLPEPLPKAPVR
jgi:hypothetical protein